MDNKITPKEKIKRIKGRLKNAVTSNTYNPRNILGKPKRYYTKGKGTRGDFNRADLRHAASKMDKAAKEVARLMERKSRGLKVSEAKIQGLLVKGKQLANRYNNIIDEAGGSSKQHVVFYDKKNETGRVWEYFDAKVDGQSMGTGLNKKQAETVLKAPKRIYAKEIPDLVDESKLPKPKLIKTYRAK